MIYSNPTLSRPRRILAFSAADSPAYSKLLMNTYKIINEHSKQFEIELKFLPQKRQIVEANGGIIDGLAAKVESNPENEEYPNLIKVPTPLFYMDLIIAIPIDEPDLVNADFFLKNKVAMLNGAVHSRKLVPKHSRVFVNTHLSGFLMVAAKRVPAMSTLAIAYYVTANESTEVAEKTRLAEFKVKEPFYMFVHFKNRELVSELNALLTAESVASKMQKACDDLIAELKMAQKMKK